MSALTQKTMEFLSIKEYKRKLTIKKLNFNIKKVLQILKVKMT